MSFAVPPATTAALFREASKSPKDFRDLIPIAVVAPPTTVIALPVASRFFRTCEPNFFTASKLLSNVEVKPLSTAVIIALTV